LHAPEASIARVARSGWQRTGTIAVFWLHSAAEQTKEDNLEPENSLEHDNALDPLLRQAIDNNREALDELFARYRGRLYRQALRVLGNPEEAEDALQDGLLAAFRNLNRFKGHSRLYTWLTRIVINAALMRLRRSRYEATTSIDEGVEGDGQHWTRRIPDSRPNPEEICARQERVQVLERRLQTLRPVYRQAVWLRDVLGMSIRETAEALGVPPGSVKSHVHRGRLGLREETGPRAVRRLVPSNRATAAITRRVPTSQFTERLAPPAA
jgi:RNA polymerase sigma-70 factor (ECF subfamily)